jgi:predicted GH43/DUF377 family glycosyl hydrolase
LPEPECLPQLLERQALSLHADAGRVILRDFKPAREPLDHNPADLDRANHIIDRILSLDNAGSEERLSAALQRFEGRHRHLAERCDARAAQMDIVVDGHRPFTAAQRRLVGAYFLQEYAFEAAALFNPSIIPHPDQTGVPDGCLRFILSLRAVGEGHVSSLTFRSGMLDADGQITLDPLTGFSMLPTMVQRGYGADHDCVLVAFTGEEELSERVIFPITEAQSNGIEDARFVPFRGEGDANAPTYYATYTAYNGAAIRSEMFETSDFVSFRMTPLRGLASAGKGMALFPRRIDGQYAMIGRHDNESLYLIYSSDLHVWDSGVAILKPEYPWEFVQIGNCGSPIELDEGWLLLTHGVGPLRQYAIGAVLLDRDDPSRVLGRSREPILRPTKSEWLGYVPNVVYTCGALRHRDRIIIPYAIADSFCAFATAPIAELLASIRF